MQLIKLMIQILVTMLCTMVSSFSTQKSKINRNHFVLIASCFGHYDIVEFLLTCDTNVNKKTKNGATALNYG